MAGFFDTLFSGGAQKDAAASDMAALQTYQNTALPALQQTYNTGSQAINSGVGAYTPLANLGATYSGVAPTLMGALGTGTPQQNAAALASFQQANPGYGFQVQQASDAAARAAAAGGMSNSGNALIAADKYAQGLANNTYQQWVQNLQNTGQMGLSATSGAAAGQAGQYDALANLAQNYGQNQAGVASNVYSGTANANQMVAQGEQQGASNLLGAGLGLASLALGPAGSTALKGLGSSLSSLGSSAYGGIMGQQWQAANPGAWGSNFAGPVAPG